MKPNNCDSTARSSCWKHSCAHRVPESAGSCFVAFFDHQLQWPGATATPMSSRVSLTGSNQTSTLVGTSRSVGLMIHRKMNSHTKRQLDDPSRVDLTARATLFLPHNHRTNTVQLRPCHFFLALRQCSGLRHAEAKVH